MGINREELIDFLKTESNPYKQLYEKCWSLKEYRRVAPGEKALDLFIEAASPTKGTTVVDWGCGTGRAGYRLWKEKDMDVTLVDFASNCLDDKIREACEEGNGIRFREHDLAQKLHLPSQFGICADVMEHIPEEQIDAVLDTILNNSRNVFFQIATIEDSFGDHDEIDERLHVTIKPYQWWLERLVQKKVIVLRSNDLDQYCIFYVTGWGSPRLNWTGGQLNEDKDVLLSNIRENAKLNLQPVIPHQPQDTDIMILAGGPSLNDFTDEIIEQRKAGMPLITANGTYNWAIEKGLKPSMQMVIDGRAFNKRFVEPVIDDCKYVVASQCHPELVKSLPPERTYIWQVNTDPEWLEVTEESYGKMYKDWYPCPGGSTVLLRGLCLLRMLGFHRFIIYGFDSCVRGNTHHAYEQKENDGKKTTPMVVGKNTRFEKTFQCEPWMVYQAKEFQLMVPRILKDASLQVKGDGLIAYMINSGAEMAADEEN